jgi:hypothetical protein
MLPLILGIGAAALLLGRKAVKRVRRNPLRPHRKQYAIRRRQRAKFWSKVRRIQQSGRRAEHRARIAKRNPHGGLHKKIDVYVNGRYFWSTNKHATCASAKADALAALRKRASAGKVPIPSSGWNVVAHFDARQRNPARRRKGKRVSVDQAASRLAWWRWHHNPKRKMTRSEARAFFDAMYAGGQSRQESRLRSPAGEAERQARNRAAPARLRAKTNPRRRRRASRRK